MSVINQVLLDLEKRRASGSELGALPNHVRALPEGERTLHWGWVAGGGVAVAAVVAVSWALLSGFDWTRQRTTAVQTPQRGNEVAIGKVATAAAGTATDVRPRDEGGGAQMEAPASRLSLELSSPSAAAGQAAEQVVADERSPLPTTRVVGRTESDSSPRSDTPAAPAGRPAPAKSAAVVASSKAMASTPAARPEIQKEVRQPTPRDLAENEYRKATASLHQGRQAEAQEGFQAALNLHAGHHGARQALVGLLLDGKKYSEAERVLQEGLKLAPSQTGFTMTLARLQVDRGDNKQAIATLQRGLEYAQGNADYAAFLAALLQRDGQHEEAIEQFQAALRLRPASGVWWLGLGISLQAINRAAEAQDAYRRARATNNLSPDLQAFADQRLLQLQ